MGVKISILMLVMIFLVSCTAETSPEQLQEPLVFVVEGQGYDKIPDNIQKQLTFVVSEKTLQPLEFIVSEKDPLAWVKQSIEKRHRINTDRALREDSDEQEVFEKRSKLSNVRRIVVNDQGHTEVIFGYDEGLDDPKFRDV